MSTVSTAPLSGRYLSFGEREENRDLVCAGCRHSGDRSTISRELGRNAATRSGSFTYRATAAQWHADRRADGPWRRRPSSATRAWS